MNAQQNVSRLEAELKQLRTLTNYLYTQITKQSSISLPPRYAEVLDNLETSTSFINSFISFGLNPESIKELQQTALQLKETITIISELEQGHNWATQSLLDLRLDENDFKRLSDNTGADLLTISNKCALYLKHGKYTTDFYIIDNQPGTLTLTDFSGKTFSYVIPPHKIINQIEELTYGTGVVIYVNYSSQIFKCNSYSINIPTNETNVIETTNLDMYETYEQLISDIPPQSFAISSTLNVEYDPESVHVSVVREDVMNIISNFYKLRLQSYLNPNSETNLFTMTTQASLSAIAQTETMLSNTVIKENVTYTYDGTEPINIGMVEHYTDAVDEHNASHNVKYSVNLTVQGVPSTATPSHYVQKVIFPELRVPTPEGEGALVTPVYKKSETITIKRSTDSNKEGVALLSASFLPFRYHVETWLDTNAGSLFLKDGKIVETINGELNFMANHYRSLDTNASSGGTNDSQMFITCEDGGDSGLVYYGRKARQMVTGTIEFRISADNILDVGSGTDVSFVIDYEIDSISYSETVTMTRQYVVEGEKQSLFYVGHSQKHSFELDLFHGMASPYNTKDGAFTKSVLKDTRPVTFTTSPDTSTKKIAQLPGITFPKCGLYFKTLESLPVDNIYDKADYYFADEFIFNNSVMEKWSSHKFRCYLGGNVLRDAIGPTVTKPYTYTVSNIGGHTTGDDVYFTVKGFNNNDNDIIYLSNKYGSPNPIVMGASSLKSYFKKEIVIRNVVSSPTFELALPYGLTSTTKISEYILNNVNNTNLLLSLTTYLGARVDNLEDTVESLVEAFQGMAEPLSFFGQLGKLLGAIGNTAGLFFPIVGVSFMAISSVFTSIDSFTDGELATGTAELVFGMGSIALGLHKLGKRWKTRRFPKGDAMPTYTPAKDQIGTSVSGDPPPSYNSLFGTVRRSVRTSTTTVVDTINPSIGQTVIHDASVIDHLDLRDCSINQLEFFFLLGATEAKREIDPASRLSSPIFTTSVQDTYDKDGNVLTTSEYCDLLYSIDDVPVRVIMDDKKFSMYYDFWTDGSMQTFIRHRELLFKPRDSISTYAVDINIAQSLMFGTGYDIVYGDAVQSRDRRATTFSILDFIIPTNERFFSSPQDNIQLFYGCSPSNLAHSKIMERVFSRLQATKLFTLFDPDSVKIGGTTV